MTIRAFVLKENIAKLMKKKFCFKKIKTVVLSQ